MYSMSINRLSGKPIICHHDTSEEQMFSPLWLLSFCGKNITALFLFDLS